MILYISSFLEIIFNREQNDLYNLINRLFADFHDSDLKEVQKNCSYILACVGYECFRTSSINERKAAEALFDCNSLFSTASLDSLQQLFTSIMNNIYQTAAGGSDPVHYDILDTVNGLLYKDCAAISLQEAADLVGISAASFSINFKKKTGSHFKDYVRAQKMELAKRMLKDTENSVKTISEDLGYYDYNYFTRIFKTTFGVTPTSYRRSIHN